MAGAEELSNVSIEWRSSLPTDPMEAATIESVRHGAKAASVRSSISRLDPDASEEDLDAEEARIKDEELERAKGLL